MKKLFIGGLFLVGFAAIAATIGGPTVGGGGGAPAASQAEVTTGTISNKYVSPATLAGYSLAQSTGSVSSVTVTQIVNAAVGNYVEKLNGRGTNATFYIDSGAWFLAEQYTGLHFLGYDNSAWAGGTDALISEVPYTNTVGIGGNGQYLFALNGTNISDGTIPSNKLAFAIGSSDAFWFTNPAAASSVSNAFATKVASLVVDGRTNRNAPIGVRALEANTTGFDNVAVGDETLKVLTTGFRNTVVGAGAAQAITTAQDNTVVGVESLLGTTNGSYNVAIGTYAMKENLSGGNNIAIGVHNSQENRTGSDNVAVGMQALQTGTASTRNVAIGKSTLNLNTNTTGRNVAIGYRAGGSSSNVTGTVNIGYQAGYSSQLDNTLNIDNDDTATPLIFGDFAGNALAFNGSVTNLGHMSFMPDNTYDIGSSAARRPRSGYFSANVAVGSSGYLLFGSTRGRLGALSDGLFQFWNAAVSEPGSLLISNLYVTNSINIGANSINSWDDVTNYFTMPAGGSGSDVWTNTIPIVNTVWATNLTAPTGMADKRMTFIVDNSKIEFHNTNILIQATEPGSTITLDGNVVMPTGTLATTGNVTATGTSNYVAALHTDTFSPNELNVADLNATNVIVVGKSNALVGLTAAGALTDVALVGASYSGNTLTVTASGTGSTNLFDVGTNLVARGSFVMTNSGPSAFVVGATNATGGTNHFEVVGLDGAKKLNVGTNGTTYLADLSVSGNSTVSSNITVTGSVIGNGSGLTNLNLNSFGLLTNYQQFTNTTYIRKDALGTTITPSLWLTNATAASDGAPQMSPALVLGGQGWKSTGSSNISVGMAMHVLPVQGTTATPVSRLFFNAWTNGVVAGGGFYSAYLDSLGALNVGASITAGAGITAGSTAAIGWSTKGYILSPVDGVFSFTKSDLSTNTVIMLGGDMSTSAKLVTSSNWPALRVESATNNVTLAVRKGTNNVTGDYASLVAATYTMPTNYVAANFAPISGKIIIAASNNVIYGISSVKTNVLLNLE